jgi:predicted glycoside hydrolase/deacetylase ChbG (UPF0249 family)
MVARSIELQPLRQSTIRAGGLLIINGDDWGRSQRATDAILDCYAAGRLTTASAMVYMEDSARAAHLAAAHHLPVGLHLNLTDPYTSDLTPPDVRRRQLRAARFFRAHRFARWLYNPFVAAAVGSAILDQLAEFKSLYGTDPTHIDGHHHIHVTPNVLLAGAVPTGCRMGSSLTFLRGEKPSFNRVWRAAFNRYIRRRHPSVDYLFDLSSIRLSGDDPSSSRHLELASCAKVAIVCHPECCDDYTLLMSRAWSEVLREHTTGTYESIGRTG